MMVRDVNVPTLEEYKLKEPVQLPSNEVKVSISGECELEEPKSLEKVNAELAMTFEEVTVSLYLS